MVLSNIDSETERLMREGQDAAKRGDKAMARALLTQLVEHDPENEQGWMWLSGVVTDLGDQETCLRNVLIINPNNAQAQKGLRFLDAGKGAETGAAPASTENSAAETPNHPVEPAARPANSPQTPLLPWEVAPAVPADPPMVNLTKAADDAALLASWQQLQASVNETAQESGWSWEAAEDPSGGADEDADEDAKESTHARADIETPQSANADVTTPAVPAFDPFAVSFDSPNTMVPLSGLPQQESHSNAVTPMPPWVHGDAGMEQVPPTIDLGTMPDFSHLLDGDGALDRVPLPASDGDDLRFGGSVLPNPVAPVGPMGPYTAGDLPLPADLPGVHVDTPEQSQPWYLQSSKTNIPMPSEFDLDSDQANMGTGSLTGESLVEVQTIECPNCHQNVPDTVLVCPECTYNFFAHCPHCHELVDTGEAKLGVFEACPHCGANINKMEMGLLYSTGLASAQMPVKEENPEAWVGAALAIPEPPKSNSAMAWVVDIMWLLAVVLVIWALTQLPTWLHLTNLYN